MANSGTVKSNQMKKITISGVLYEYTTHTELLAILAKYPNITVSKGFVIGDNSNIHSRFTAGDGFTAGDRFRAGDYFTVGDRFTAGDDFTAGYYFTVGDRFTAGDGFTAGDRFRAGGYFTVGDRFTAGDDFTAGYYFTVGDRFTAGDGFTAGDRFRAGDGFRISLIVNLDGGYKYNGAVFKNETDGLVYIKLGCFTRTIKQWEDYFWNNDDEFPNDGKKKSQDRLLTFQKLLKIAEVI